MTTWIVPRATHRAIARQPVWFDFGAMDRFMLEMWRDLAREEGLSSAGLPTVQVTTDASASVITLQAPGLRKGDWEVDLRGNTLVITADTARTEAERAQATPADSDQVPVRRTRFTFQRSWELEPRTFRLEDIEARFVDGALRVTLPRVAAAAPRPIPVSE